MAMILQNNSEMTMNGDLNSYLPALLALAHDRSESGRVALAEKLAEVFLTEAVALTNHEEALVNELIVELLKNNNDTVRHALLERFAEAVHAPRPVALRIVSGPIEVARSVLSGNANLTDDDLIMMVDKKGGEHAAAIAVREEISEAVADALVTTGDLHIMQIVAENMGAKLSSRALDVLIDSARLTSMLHKPILLRPELNTDRAARLYWWVSQELRRTTLERFGFGPGRLDEALAKALDEMLAVHHLQKEDDDTMNHLANWMEERGAITTKILPQLLRTGHYRLFNILLSRMAKLDLPLVDVITGAMGGRLMVPLCRAIGIDKGSFVSIFLMSRGGRQDEQIVHPHELTSALAAFDRLNNETAMAILTTWRTNPAELMQQASAPPSDDES